MAAGDTFGLEVFDDELGRYVVVPDPSAKPLAVRKQSPKATQKRRFEAKQAERRRANEAAMANVDKLGSGIASIPGRVVNYIKSSSPSSVARDVKGLAKSTIDAAVENPNAFIEDAIASIPAGIRDFGDVRETARKLRAQGRKDEAEAMEAMAGTAVLSALPIIGRPAGVAVRNAIKAAEKTAIKGAAKTSEMAVTPKAEKPLTEKQFERNYLQHIDLRNRGKKAGEVAEKIKTEGFRPGAGMNLMNVWRGGEPRDIMQSRFLPRKDDVVYLVPKSAQVKMSGYGEKIAEGWKPAPHEVHTIAETGQDMYQAYLDKFAAKTKTAPKAKPVVKGIANPIHEVALEFGSDVARRLEGMIPSDAPLSEWRAAAQGIAGSDIPNASMPAPRPYSVRPADVAVDPRIESRKGELGKIADLKVELAPRVTDPAPEVSIFDYEGHPYITSMSDLAAAGDDITAINDVRFRVPFSRRGGQDYMFDNPGSVWASERGPAERHVELADQLQQMTGKDVLYMPWTMGPNAVKFSHMPRGIQYSYADAALDGADRNALASEIKSILPNWRGFEDPDSAEMFMTVTGKARGALNTVMDKYRNRGGLGGGEAVYAATDLDQMNTPLTTLRNVGIIDPRFGASPSSHASYNYSIPGRGVGRLKENIGALGLSPDVMAALNYETPFDFPVGVQPGTKSPLRAMQMKPQGGVLDYDTLRFLEGLLEKDKK
jgi:hypothetical protein